MSTALNLLRPDRPCVAAAESLAGKVVLVTGAYGGLGSATAKAAAGAGATVVLVGRKASALEPVYDAIELAGGPQPFLFPMDLAKASPEDFEAVADAIERECGRLDGIVHAAAAFDGLKPLDQQKPAEWQRLQQVIVGAPFLLQRACMPLLKESSSPAIVHVFDDPQRIRGPFWGSYGVAKQALEGLFSISHHESENGPLRIHGLLPAPMRTQLRRMGWFGEDTMQLPLPDAAGAAAAFLLTDAAESYRGRVLDLRPAPDPA